MDRKKFIASTIIGLAGAKLQLASERNRNIDISKSTITGKVGYNHLPEEDKTMQSIIHKSNTRGQANHGWLEAKHSFSFANYYNPNRMNFGVLRVLNDDRIAEGRGFGTHPHDNMEIITIPLEGDLEHKDSMGNSSIIKSGEVQVMSAGTGIYHSEFNPNPDREVKLLQIWVMPNKRDVKPRYDQMKLDRDKLKNNFTQILSPSAEDEGVWIHQNAWFHLGEFDQGKEVAYEIKDPSNGVYAFVIDGKIEIEDNELSDRDAIGLWDAKKFVMTSKTNSKVLLLEVPMEL